MTLRVNKADDETCDCILSATPEFGPHTVGEHRREPCPGSWTFDPPCGGCINCLEAQAHYYRTGETVEDRAAAQRAVDAQNGSKA